MSPKGKSIASRESSIRKKVHLVRPPRMEGKVKEAMMQPSKKKPKKRGKK